MWLKTRAQGGTRGAARSGAAFRFRLTPAAMQALLFMAFLQFQNAAIYSFYPTLLRTVHGFTPTSVFPAVAAYCAGSLIGKPLCGWAAIRFGERTTLLVYLGVTVLDIVPFASGTGTSVLLAASFIMGLFGNSVFALVPNYLSQRFPSRTRSLGMGLSYALASAGNGLAGFLVPWGGAMLGLARSIEICVMVGSLIVGAIAARKPAELPGAHMEGDRA